jgi:hypothetical protein
MRQLLSQSSPTPSAGRSRHRPSLAVCMMLSPNGPEASVDARQHPRHKERHEHPSSLSFTQPRTPAPHATPARGTAWTPLSAEAGCSTALRCQKPHYMCTLVNLHVSISAAALLSTKATPKYRAGGCCCRAGTCTVTLRLGRWTALHVAATPAIRQGVQS